MKSLTHLSLVSICVPWYVKQKAMYAWWSIFQIALLKQAEEEEKDSFPSQKSCTVSLGVVHGRTLLEPIAEVFGQRAVLGRRAPWLSRYKSHFILVWNTVTLCWRFGFRVSALLQVFAEEQLWTFFIPAFLFQKHSRSVSFCVCLQEYYKVTHEFRSNAVNMTVHYCHGITCASIFARERMCSS